MGVKSLWNLLEPVGRPVLLETMEGKAMAIDSSIWIYQFQATMRDKEGRGLVNAHVLGFLRRISKLLFYGIKPVFVFDGGAPTLKRSTIAERKRKKSGAVASHAKVAERLLAAHMRRAALDHAQDQRSRTARTKPGIPTGPVTIDDNTVYLEDLEGPTPRTPAKKTPKEAQDSPPSSKKKSRWHDHDPYRLPDVNMDDMVAKATRSNAPDPRLATEEELRAFIDEMRPEDFDVKSPAFRELPTEVQYEIIGDLRLKSRQTSYKRLQNMLKSAKTPLDFSKEQIKNLKQRNALTQQLLVTTDSIGKAHVEIPIRIASERNKEYILIKNEGDVGGWILGIRDEGTRAKPIEIDQDNVQQAESDDDDMDMEEVAIDAPSSVDPDLREFRRQQALAALADRYSPKKLAPLTTKPVIRKKQKPLFVPEDSDQEHVDADDEQEDPALQIAIQQSLEDEEADNLEMAIQASKADGLWSVRRSEIPGSNVGASTSRSTLDNTRPVTPTRSPARRSLDAGFAISSDSDDDLYASPTRLETALSIAGTGPKRSPTLLTRPLPHSPESMFGPARLLLPNQDDVSPSHRPPAIELSSDSDMEEVAVAVPQPVVVSESKSRKRIEPTLSSLSEEDDMEAVAAVDFTNPQSPIPIDTTDRLTPEPSASEDGRDDVSPQKITNDAIARPLTSRSASADRISETAVQSSVNEISPPQPPESESDSENEAWSEEATTLVASDTGPKQTNPVLDDWDAAQEMDPHAEEGEYVQFMSHVRGKNLEEVRREIDEEIRVLNQQKKVAMRDSEDVTQQMVTQIMMMLRLFGIPYITAPMEAEAQCAELLSLGLVDGIITDDSDVFLFGGIRVLRNMFNQSKTVECFLLSDLERELSLDRDKLVRLAYLLGSDYTEGLPGVGPVVAMELLTEFPGVGGLHEFREWWRKVQSGKDAPDDNKSKFRKRFKKRFKELYLPEDWPNPAVRDAYFHPTVDSSEEPFKWGLPDLDALRGFFNAELGWNQAKVDDLLLPIIRKMGKRSQSGSANQQGNLTAFFDVPAGGVAPRKRQAYASKRLQQVVSDFRKQQAADAKTAKASRNRSETASDGSEYEGDAPARQKKKRKTKGDDQDKAKKTTSKKTRGGTRGRGRGRGRGKSTAAESERANPESSSSATSQ